MNLNSVNHDFAGLHISKRILIVAGLAAVSFGLVSIIPAFADERSASHRIETESTSAQPGLMERILAMGCVRKTDDARIYGPSKLRALRRTWANGCADAAPAASLIDAPVQSCDAGAARNRKIGPSKIHRPATDVSDCG